MLNFQIPNAVWVFVAGAFVALFVLAVTFNYLPSPREMFRDVAAECRQSGINKNNGTGGSQNAAQSGEPALQQRNSEQSKDETTKQKEINDCLLAAYTRSLSDFTKWLVFVTAA